MKRIVVDTNLAFSAFLNVNSHIGQLLLDGSKYFDFYAPEYINFELIKYKERIKEIGNFDEKRFIELYGMIIQNIHLLSHSIIPVSFYKTAIKYCVDIDEDDTPFIAVNDFIKGWLWTGDLKLIRGLSSKGYKRIITTNELYALFILKESKK